MAEGKVCGYEGEKQPETFGRVQNRESRREHWNIARKLDLVLKRGAGVVGEQGRSLRDKDRECGKRLKEREGQERGQKEREHSQEW